MTLRSSKDSDHLLRMSFDRQFNSYEPTVLSWRPDNIFAIKFICQRDNNQRNFKVRMLDTNLSNTQPVLSLSNLAYKKSRQLAQRKLSFDYCNWLEPGVQYKVNLQCGPLYAQLSIYILYRSYTTPKCDSALWSSSISKPDCKTLHNQPLTRSEFLTELPLHKTVDFR